MILEKILFSNIFYDQDAKHQIFKRDELKVLNWKSFIQPKLQLKFQQGAPVQFIKSNSNSAYPYTDLSYTEDVPVSSGWFLCCDESADTKDFTPIQMITEILSNEEELRLFCKQNQIGAPDDQYQK